MQRMGVGWLWGGESPAASATEPAAVLSAFVYLFPPQKKTPNPQIFAFLGTMNVAVEERMDVLFPAFFLPSKLRCEFVTLVRF